MTATTPFWRKRICYDMVSLLILHNIHFTLTVYERVNVCVVKYRIWILGVAVEIVKWNYYKMLKNVIVAEKLITVSNSWETFAQIHGNKIRKHH